VRRIAKAILDLNSRDRPTGSVSSPVEKPAHYGMTVYYWGDFMEAVLNEEVILNEEAELMVTSGREVKIVRTPKLNNADSSGELVGVDENGFCIFNKFSKSGY